LGAPLRFFGHPAGQKLPSPPGVVAIPMPHPAEELQKLMILLGLSDQGLVLFTPSKGDAIKRMLHVYSSPSPD
jgi:hypothetical protein